MWIYLATMLALTGAKQASVTSPRWVIGAGATAQHRVERTTITARALAGLASEATPWHRALTQASGWVKRTTMQACAWARGAGEPLPWWLRCTFTCASIFVKDTAISTHTWALCALEAFPWRLSRASAGASDRVKRATVLASAFTGVA